MKKGVIWVSADTPQHAAVHARYFYFKLLVIVQFFNSEI
jgi:hypothetical protein